MTPKESLDFYCARCGRETRHNFIILTGLASGPKPPNIPNYFLYQCKEGCEAIVPILQSEYLAILENIKTP